MLILCSRYVFLHLHHSHVHSLYYHVMYVIIIYKWTRNKLFIPPCQCGVTYYSPMSMRCYCLFPHVNAVLLFFPHVNEVLLFIPPCQWSVTLFPHIFQFFNTHHFKTKTQEQISAQLNGRYRLTRMFSAGTCRRQILTWHITLDYRIIGLKSFLLKCPLVAILIFSVYS